MHLWVINTQVSRRADLIRQLWFIKFYVFGLRRIVFQYLLVSHKEKPTSIWDFALMIYVWIQWSVITVTGLYSFNIIIIIILNYSKRKFLISRMIFCISDHYKIILWWPYFNWMSLGSNKDTYESVCVNIRPIKRTRQIKIHLSQPKKRNCKQKRF